MKKKIINEMSRMKSLFGYKRGVVISEQPDEKFDTPANKQITRELNKPAANTPNTQPAQQPTTTVKGSNISEYPECVKKFGNPKPSKSGKQYSIIGTGDWKDYYFYSNGKYGSFKIDTPPPHGTYSCNNGVIVMGTPNKTVTPNSPVVPKKQVTIPKPKELKDVKHFQDWLDQKHPGWHKKYKTLNKSVPKGYGIFGPNTSAAWNQYKNEYLNVKQTLDTGSDTLEMGDEPQQNNLLWSNPTDIQGNPVNPAPPKVS